MKYAPDRSTVSRELKMTRVHRISSRSDLFPRLVAMQKLMDAQNFAIYRVAGSGLPSRLHLVCELENWGPGNLTASKSIVDAYGEDMLEHIEKSLLPLMWNGIDDDRTAEAIDFTQFTQRLKSKMLPCAGVAFPVRLGTVGNGFVVFTANFIDLTSELR